MSAPADDGPPRRLGDFVRERRDAIIADWVVAVRDLRPARSLDRPALLDHMPQFLDTLADYVDRTRGGDDSAPSQEMPRIHAIERLDQGYDLDEVVAEYRALRRCLVALVVREHAPALRSAEMPRLHDAIDSAIAASVVRFAAARERLLKALDRISTAALGGADVQDFLTGTLEVLRDTAESVDSVSVLLLEGGALRVRASAGLARPPSAAGVVRLGECFAGRIAQTRAPQRVRDAATDPSVCTDIVDRARTHALYGVPLLIKDELIGVAVMGSSSTFEFSHEDQVLFRTMAARATTIIVQGRLKDELRQRNEMYRSLLDAQSSAGEGLLILAGKRIAFANDAVARISGYSHEELLALETFETLLSPEYRALLEERSARRQRGEPVGPVHEGTFIRKDGQRVEVEVATQPLGEQVVVIARDISTRRQAEREREAARARLDAILRVLPVGVVIGEAPSGRLILANREAEQILGVLRLSPSVEEYAAYRGTWADGVPIGPHDWPLARAIEKGEVIDRVEIRLIRPDGSVRVTEQAAAPVRDADGRIAAGVVTIVDITAHKSDEERLKQALRFRDNMIGVLSHDLRSPLSVVKSSADLAARSMTEERGKRALARIDHAVERMSRMISDLLDYTRAKMAAGIPVERRPMNAAALARQIVDELQPVHPDRPLRVATSGETDGSWDEARVAQLLSNLIANAIQHGRPGSPIDIAVRGEPGSLLIEIHNEGAPIPAEALPTIFGAFRKATPERRTGLGLGLYIVREIAGAHGGTVDVRSTAEEGTTFSVRLPR